MSLEAIARDAAAAGVVIYDRPDGLDYEKLDAPIREACRRINASGWVFTAESCSGHPDATSKFVWGFNQPYLRLTCRSERMGQLLDLLSRAAASYLDPEDHGLGVPFGLQVWRYADRGEYSQVGVYLEGKTVWQRDAAMRIFEAFGDSAQAAA